MAPCRAKPPSKTSTMLVQYVSKVNRGWFSIKEDESNFKQSWSLKDLLPYVKKKNSPKYICLKRNKMGATIFGPCWAGPMYNWRQANQAIPAG